MSAQLRTLAVLLPWVMRHPEGVPVDEVCATFGLEPDALEALLDEGLMIGLAPFTPLEYLDCQIVDGNVVVQPYAGLDTPPRPTATEALQALQAANAVLGLDGFEQADALRGARDALDAFLAEAGVDASGLQADLRLPGSESAPALRDAASAGTQLRIEYQKPGGALGERVVDPFGVFVDHRAWYLDAFDHHAGDRRTFRLDRIRSFTPTGEHFEPQRMRTGLHIEPSADAIAVRLRIAPSASWLIDPLTLDDRTVDADGTIDVTFRTDALRWVVPLIVSGGAAVRVLEPPALLDAVRHAASSALAAYR